jgi:hypothetical protein
MIFEEIDDVKDAIMLGLTHDTLMVIGWNHIQSLLAQELPPWAGCRIICVGSWGEDLPEGVMSEEEEEKLRKLSGLYSEPESRDAFNLYDISGTIYNSPFIGNHLGHSGLYLVESRVFDEIIDEGYYGRMDGCS